MIWYQEPTADAGSNFSINTDPDGLLETDDGSPMLFVFDMNQAVGTYPITDYHNDVVNATYEVQHEPVSTGAGHWVKHIVKFDVTADVVFRFEWNIGLNIHFTYPSIIAV